MSSVHFVLDEMAVINHMDSIDDAVGIGRGYGIRLQCYFQSLGQMKKCFPEGQELTLLSNSTQIFFGVNDNSTAEYVSTRLGEHTIIVDSGGTSRGGSSQWSPGGQPPSHSTSWNSNSNWQPQARRLLKPEEIMALSNRAAIAFAPGVSPIYTTLLRYYEERQLGRPPGWARQKVRAGVVLVASAALFAVVASAAVWLTLASHRETRTPRAFPNAPRQVWQESNQQ